MLFESLAANIYSHGYSVHTNALPAALSQRLWAQSHSDEHTELKPAGIGRKVDHHINKTIRSDKICWIDDTTGTGIEWNQWAAGLQASLNASLYLGLFTFESHYALFSPGGFYATHCDAFQGEKNRILSIIIYLNHDWQPSDGGELVLFTDGEARAPLRVKPEFGTVVVFLSEEIPHEVLVTNRDRYSIAGWFYANRGNPAR